MPLRCKRLLEMEENAKKMWRKNNENQYFGEQMMINVFEKQTNIREARSWKMVPLVRKMMRLIRQYKSMLKFMRNSHLPLSYSHGGEEPRRDRGW